MKVRPRYARLRTFLVLGVAMGLVYGLLEALEFVVLSFVPGALAWRSGNSPRALWVAPLVYGTVGMLLGLAFFALSRAARRLDWMRVFVFTALAGGTFLGAMLQGQVFSTLASVLLALGLGTQLTRVFCRHRDRVLAAAPRLAVVAALLVAATAAAELGTHRLRERIALDGLAPAQRRPNVLVVVADTLRADHVSGYGYARPTTPNIDALATSSRTFVNAYSASSWTLPAHASLMTGRTVREHRAGNAGRPYLDARFPTLAEVLGASGYAAGGFVANAFWCGRQTGLDRGFLHYDDLYGNLGDALARTVLGRLLAYHVLPHFGFVDIPGRRSAGDINDRLLAWIDDLPADRPFFGFVNYMDVHGPYLPPRGFAGRFSASGTASRAARIELGDIDRDTKVPDAALLRHWIDSYDEALLYLDSEVGRLIAALRERGKLDDTILVFTSDHGESWGEHGLVFHGHSLYQEQVRIPLIVHYPREIGAERVASPVSLDRVPAMIAALVGLPSAPFGDASAPDSADIAFSQVSRRNGMPPTWPTATGGLRSVQSEQFQLIMGDTRPAELYDIVADRAQLHDLAHDPSHADVLQKLRMRLDAVAPPESAASTRHD